ncbi:MAG: hypothetical protein ACUVYA_16515 [Planctomycetota bacterium]
MTGRRWAIFGCALAGLAAAGGAALEKGSPRGDGSVRRIELNALDYCLEVYDLGGGGPGYSRQFDESVRLYFGDVLFSGEKLVAIENERRTGSIADLGKNEAPDTEFSLFHGLRLWKRNLQRRQFPFPDRYLPFEGFDSKAFFAEREAPQTSAEVRLGHVYVVRLFDRARVGGDRVFLLKAIEFAPGVRVVFLSRELEDEGRG